VQTPPKGFPVLIDRPSLDFRIAEMARELLDAGEADPHLICVLDGGRTFADRICKAMGREAGAYDTIKLASYGAGTTSSGAVRIVKEMSLEVRGRRVVILEDIVDTGRTLAFLKRILLERGAASIEICTLLDKPSRRVVDVDVDLAGFEIPDVFVIGFGMDLNGRYRDLPYVGIYEEASEGQQAS